MYTLGACLLNSPVWGMSARQWVKRVWLQCRMRTDMFVFLAAAL